MKLIFMIVNQQACGGNAGRHWSRLADLLRKRDIHFEERVTEHPGEGVKLARQAVSLGADIIAAAGGDGTVHEVVNGMAQAALPIQTPLAIIPIGRGNDFAESLGINCRIETIVRRLTQGREKRVDLGYLLCQGRDGTVGRYFVNLAAGGQASELVHLVEQPILRHVPARAAYALALGMTAVREHHWKVRVASPGESTEETLDAVLICNGPLAGGGMQVAPDAELDDSRLELIEIPHLGRGETLRELPHIYSGAYLKNPKVVHRTIREVEITSAEPLPFELDGEVVGTTPVYCMVIPRALAVLV